jgi:hypothetical protein
MFDRLYVMNGTFYIVSNAPRETLPELKYVISKGHWIENGQEKMDARLPSDKEIQVINTDTAKRLFGTGADRIDGMTVRDEATCLGNIYLMATGSGWQMILANCAYAPFAFAERYLTTVP